VFIYKIPQALLIQDIPQVSYLPEGYGESWQELPGVIMDVRLKRKAY
jgi:hypothetical protein